MKVDDDIVEKTKREILLKRYCLGSRILVLCAYPFFFKKIIMQCSVTVYSKVPSALQYTAQAIKRNLMRNVK